MSVPKKTEKSRVVDLCEKFGYQRSKVNFHLIPDCNTFLDHLMALEGSPMTLKASSL